MKIVPTIKITNDDILISRNVENFRDSHVKTIRFVVTKASLEDHVNFIKKFEERALSITGYKFNLMLDIPYPKDKIRFEFLDNSLDSIKLEYGEEINIVNDKSFASRDYKNFYVNSSFARQKRGRKAVIGDGDLLIEFLGINDKYILAKCLNSVTFNKGKAIASPEGFLKYTDTDIKNKSLELIKLLKPEICVLSYIETCDDVSECTKEIKEYAAYIPEIMSKVETYKACINVKEIISKSDSIMLARGCLAVNIGIENLPLAQKSVLETCKSENIDVCLASNILRSLGEKNVPTRADICDLQYMIESGLDYFVITDGFSMSDKFLKAVYYIDYLYKNG
jgi:pyruvate kinase